MDHSPFENLFKTLLPIIIFIIWALLSRPAQKKKKEQEALRRRRQKELETAENTLPETDRPVDEQVREHGAAKDDWKRSLEDVLEEMGLPVERKPAPPPVNQPANEKAAPPPESLEEESLEDLEPEVVPEKVVDEKMKSHLAIQEAAYTLSVSPIDSQKVYATATESTPALISETTHETVIAKYAAGELQKFIVWSELLGRPVALRDENNFQKS
jgi:hypothetical protein